MCIRDRFGGVLARTWIERLGRKLEIGEPPEMYGPFMVTLLRFAIERKERANASAFMNDQANELVEGREGRQPIDVWTDFGIALDDFTERLDRERNPAPWNAASPVGDDRDFEKEMEAIVSE